MVFSLKFIAMSAKGQHTIPRLHLQHFAGRQPAGQVWTYDAVEAEQWSAIPKETCVQTHFYSVERDDGTMDTRVEDFLAKVESCAAPVYEGLLKGILPSDPQAGFDFAQFLALIFTRTTAMRRMAAKVHGHGAQILSYAYATNPKAFEGLMRRVESDKGEPIDPAIKEQLKRKMLNPSGFVMEVSKESTLSVLGASDKLTPVLNTMKWSLITARHGYFITSDNPLVRRVDRRSWHPLYGDHGFMNNTAEVTFPISPKLLLLLSWKEDGLYYGVLERDHVHELNAVRAAHSDRYLFAHIKDQRIARLAARFKDSRPDMTTRGFGPKQFARIEVPRRSKTR
jgi:hypothetical protein